MADSKKKLFTAEDIFGTPKTDEEVIDLIRRQPGGYKLYEDMPAHMQKQLVSFLSGKGSLELLYDGFFRKIFDPYVHKERVEALISALIGQKVKIRDILSREGFQVSDKHSLVIMDIIVELEDRSYVDVELQKVGYRFPSQRSSCYVSDMIMRQYNIRKKEMGEKFNYKDISPVYLFVLMADSPKEFNKPGQYIHKRITSYSSGISLPETAQITYFTLDTFKETVENISNDLEAWLTLLIRDDAESVINLVNKYPEFGDIYSEVAEFRKDPAEVIDMFFSAALKEMDHNTELYMIDELKAEVEEWKKQVETEKKKFEAEKKKAEAEKKKAEAEKKKAEAEKKKAEAEKKRADAATLRADKADKRADAADKRADAADNRADAEKLRADKAEAQLKLLSHNNGQ